MSSIDFSNGWPNWGADTNNQWVVAAAGGTVQKISNCWVEVTHSDGWKTRYYHLENVQMSSGTVSRNDRLANVANTLAEATCNGGSGTGPHVHFTLIHNGALTTLDGTVLSGWKIDSGRWAYDSDCNYMFLQKGSDKKCSYSYVRNDGAGSSPPPCPSSGGVILYKHANYDCGGEGEGSGYVIRTGTGWQNVPGSFNDQASSIRVPSGWSVKLFEHADRGGGCACRNGDDDNFWGDYLNNGVGLNDNVSSFEVFNTPNCGENHPPNTPSPQSPSDGHVAYDGRAPTLCWSKPNDPDGDQLWFYAEVYGSAVNDNSGWFRPSSDPPCWRPTKLDGQYYNYQWHVKASDLKPNGESDWSDPWHFTIERPNNPPSISFNTANGNSFPSGRIETRDRTWTFQGTAADSDGSVSRVEFRCDSCDNRGSGPDQATGTTSWSLTRNNMAGQNDVYFMVYDNQGASTASHHLDLNIDLAAPQTTVALNSERNPNRWPEWFTVPVVVSLQAQDSSTGRANVGVQEIRYRLDGGAWQTRSGADTSFTVSSDGTHTVEYYAVDRVGNAEGQRSVTFKIDRTPPTAPGAATETHGVISSQWQKDWDNPAFTWGAATDATSGVRYYWLDWKDERSGVYTPAFDPQAVRTGSYELRVWAVDYAGNVGLEGAFFTFRYDGTPPPAPAIQNNDASVSSGIWQNTVRTANFSWPAVQDEGSGVAGYNVYWGPDPDGTSGILQTGATYVNATPICAVNEAATYYLRARSQDNVDWPSEWVAYALRYDGAPPTADLVANYGLDVAHQTNVHLNIDADDVGSGVTQMRLSNDARAWSDWADVTTEIYWGIPDVGRRWNPIYLQVLDGAGNVSMVVSDTVYLDVNVPHPQSESYWLWDGAVPAGGAVVTSTNYNLRASVGQSLDSSPVTSANYRLRGGFQAGALAAPTETPTYTTYSQLGYVIAGGGACTPTLQSANYWMYGTLGQPAHVCTVTSTNYLLWSGFWGGAGTDLGAPPPPPPPPSPPTPACEFYRLSINNGAPFTNRPAITLNLCGPDAVEMMLSNDEGFSGATWQPYTQAISWTLATSGAYVLPRFVYAQFRDSVGAIHGIFFDDIIYDPSAPDGQASFDVVNLLPGTQLRSESRPLQVVSKDTTDLFLSANDDSSGLAWIQVSEYLTLTKATWQPYSAIVPITLTGDDGVKTLYVHFRDQAGNVSAPASTSFILDTEPPFGGIAIGQQIVGPAVITSTVYLGAEDNLSGVGDMRVSDEASFTHAPWQAYTNTLTWPISMTTPGTLYVQYRDLAGNISAVYSDTYLVDTVPPVLYVEIAPGDTLTRSVTILSYDALVSLGQMWLSNDPLMLDGVVSLPYTSTVTWAFDERRVIWVRLADSVGNVTEPYPAYAGGAIEYKLYLPLVMKSH
ncbi:MAG: M23 family metallopeptidase [Chloroflexi bacterium]|nr:M23 family metallopeptidase [Chloroflexota bacterium]MBU1751707.1 M23 family metallopeptidase [Chloroflexota bacterium]